MKIFDDIFIAMAVDVVPRPDCDIFKKVRPVCCDRNRPLGIGWI